MKELEYPFDSMYLLKNKKKLRKQLLEGNNWIEKRIAVLGGSTTHDIIGILELFLLNSGIKPSFYESEYAQYWQDAMFANNELLEFKPELIFIHTTSVTTTDNQYVLVFCRYELLLAELHAGKYAVLL